MPNVLQRVWSAIRNEQPAVPTPPLETKQKALGASAGLRHALSQGQPGGWATDHREEAAHYTGFNYVAINAVAKQVGKADVKVFRDGRDPQKKSLRKSWARKGIQKDYGADESAGIPLPPESRVMQLLSRPNPTQSGAAFRREQTIQLLLTGTCLVWNVPNRLGLTVERYVIPTAVAMPVPPSTDLPRGGWRVDPSACRWWSMQAMEDSDGFVENRGYLMAIGRVLPAEQVQVIREPHPIWKDDGYSALAAGSMIIDSAEQLNRSRFSSLRRGIDPSVIVSAPDDVSVTPEQVDAIQKQINSQYGGPDNVGKAMVVTAGTVTKLTTTPKEMDYIGAFPQLRDAQLALHGVPGIAAGITDGGSYAAFYASLKQFSMLTVQPVLDLLAEEDTEQLLPQFGSGLTADYEAAAIDDPEVQERELQNDLSAGTITKGEWRAIRGRQPFGDKRDDEIAGPSGSAGVGSLFGAQQPDEATTGQRRGFPDVSAIVGGDDSNDNAKHHRRRKDNPNHDSTNGQFTSGGGSSSGSGSSGESSKPPSSPHVAVAPSGQIKLKQPKTPEQANSMLDTVEHLYNEAVQKLEFARENHKPNSLESVHANLLMEHVEKQLARAIVMAKKTLGPKSHDDDLRKLIEELIEKYDLGEAVATLESAETGKRHNGFHRPSAVEKTLAAAIQGAIEGSETPAEVKAVLRGVRYP